MTISRDPDKAPEVDPEMIRTAVDHDMNVVNVIVVDENDSIQFHAVTKHVPEVDSTIILENDSSAKVRNVLHKVVRLNGHPSFFTTVYAILMVEDE